MATQRDPSQPVAVRTVTDQLLDEGLLTVVQAAGAEGIDISPKTAIRWALRGAGGARLATIKVGGRRLTSRAALRRFVAAQQVVAMPAASTIDAENANRILDGYGLGRGRRR